MHFSFFLKLFLGVQVSVLHVELHIYGTILAYLTCQSYLINFLKGLIFMF